MRTSTVAFALILTACGAMLTGSKAFFQDQKPSLTKTAGFDLGCPADQLSYTPLGHESDGYDKVGVTGCTKNGRKTEFCFRNLHFRKDLKKEL